jgi:hypothetical protein
LAAAGILGHPRATNYIFTLRRLELLENELRDAGVAFDWKGF